MSNLMQARLPDLVIGIAVGASASNAISWQAAGFDSESVTIQAPAALDAGPYTIEISMDDDLATATFATLQDATATAIVLPAAGKAVIYNGILVGFKWIRIASGAATAAVRTFKGMKSFRGC